MDVIESGGSTDAERLQRLQALDELLPALSGVLDIREVFARISEISQRVIPHDMIALPLLSEDKTTATVHAAYDAEQRIPRFPTPLPLTETHQRALKENVDHRIFDEVTPDNAHVVGPPAGHGIKSLLRVTVRLQNEVVGVLDFGSYTPHAYTPADVMIARKIADHVALALSHHRLAEESRRAAALAERTANLEMLDGLLSAVTDVLDIREIFHRVSEIAGKILPHDAMGIPIITDDREHMLVHATAGYDLNDLGIIPIPDSVRSLIDGDWEFDIIDDLGSGRGPGRERLAMLGFRSALRAPIRIGGQVAALLSFFSRQPAFYKPADAVIARRIANHVAMLMSHQRLADESRRAAALQERAKNLEMLEELLKALSGALDIREVFEQVSVIARKVIPHDMLGLPLLTEDRRHITVHATAGGTMQHAQTIPLHEKHLEMIAAGWDYRITPDLQVDPVEKDSPPAKAGYHSELLVPIRVHGEIIGGLSVFSLQEDAYTTADVLVARRIADHIALALSHQRLSEEAQRVAEARERASLLERRVDVLTAEVQALGGHRRVIGESKAWKDVLKQATQVAGTDTTVLLLGDSGTGKEVVARFIHRASARSGGPFVALNCAALPEQLLESELFGYERGAFTGALNAKPGQIEQASGGVLFLDEVSEMSLSAQAKFLRVLQEKEFQRLGGTRAMKANVRVIAATNRDLTVAIERGTFREDLYYRLHVFEIALPRLRDRPDDVLPLSEAFLEEIAKGFGRPPAGISREARRLLVEYHWPGNVRQLRNTLERAAILCEGGLITGEHLSLPGAKPAPAPPVVPASASDLITVGRPGPFGLGDGSDLKSLERAAIEKALRDAKHNKSKAAKLLGLTRTQLYVRLRKYGLET